MPPQPMNVSCQCTASIAISEYARFAFAAWLAIMATVASADIDTENFERFSLSGFGTLGLARSDHNNPQFVRDLSQPDGLEKHWSAKIDSVLGIQANYRFDDDLEGIIQALSRYRHDGSHRPEISWAFFRYDPTPDWTLRAGRLGTEFFMLADSRLIGYANTSVRPPVDSFGQLIFSNIDGFDATLTYPVKSGLLRGKISAGRTSEKSAFPAGLTWDTTGSLLYGGHLEYLTGPWQFRLARNQIRLKHEQPLQALTGLDLIALEPELVIAGTCAKYSSIGAIYEADPVQLQFMLQQTEWESAVYRDTRSGFVNLAYRIGEFSPYLGYSRSLASPMHLDTPPPEPLLGDLIRFTSATRTDQHTWTLGVRWDVMKNLALKAQIDWINGSPESVFLFRGSNDAQHWQGRMTIHSLALDFVF